MMIVDTYEESLRKWERRRRANLQIAMWLMGVAGVGLAFFLVV